ncbi:hypothetical protein JCM5296_006656 [Sporobolomyces johnsonii]
MPSLAHPPSPTLSSSPITSSAPPTIFNIFQEDDLDLVEEDVPDEDAPVSTRFTLRPYQVECINAVLSELGRGEFTRLGVSAPTGSGKTAMFTSLVHHLPPRIHPVTKEHATRVLILVSSIQLAMQTAAVVQRSWPNLLVEIEQGENEASGIADVTVATYQPLVSEEDELKLVEQVDEDVPDEEAPASTRFTLRPYQVECITAVLSELGRGEFTRLGVSAPTGSGKTAMFTSLVHHLPPRIHPVTKEHATRVLILVSSIQLATQTAAVVQRSWPNLIVEIEQGSNMASGTADVTVATYHTLARNDLARLEKFDPEYFKAVIIDEAHHAVAPSYLSILPCFDSHVSASLASSTAEGEDVPAASSISPAPSGVPPPSSSASEDSPPSLPDDPPEPVVAELDDEGRMRVPLLGFTATWGRADGLALGKLFQKIVWHGEWLDMIEGRWLSQLQFTTIRLGEALNLADVDVSSKTGEFNTESLAKAVDKGEVTDLAVKAWIDKASDRRSTLVFAVNISHIHSIANAFRERGIDARCVSQETKLKDRDELYAAFRAGEFPVLVNCRILTEGADFPEIDCILLARPTRSPTLFLQMIGRGLRLSPQTGKTNCLLIDLVGNSSSNTVCTPTLFGIDPNAIIEGKTSAELKALGDEAAAEEDADYPSYTERPASPYRDSVSAFDIVTLSDGDGGATSVPIHMLSNLAWVGCTESTWVLELIGQGYVKIVKETDEGTDRFSAHLYVRHPSDGGGEAPRYAFALPRLIASHSSLPVLLRTTDAYLANHEKYSKYKLSRDSWWRHVEATDSQCTRILDTLVSAEEQERGKRTIEGVWAGEPWSKEVQVVRLTKGQASDVISRLKHGGLGWWTRQRRVLVEKDEEWQRKKKEEDEEWERKRKEEKDEKRQRKRREKLAGRIKEALGTAETRRPAKKAWC